MRRLFMLLCLAGLMAPAMAFATGTPTFVQEHYRWRNDDGSETAATWKADADTAISGVVRGQNIRLRFAVANTGTAASGFAARLEYATNTSGPWTPVGTASDGTTPFEMKATSGYVGGEPTTMQLTGSGTFGAGLVVESPSNTSLNTSIAAANFSNYEFCLAPTAKAMGNTTYYFRVSNNSTTYTLTYNQYATLTMAAGEANEPPVIKSSLSAQVSMVANFNYTIVASGSEPIAYNATGLPPGLTFDGTSRITGLATAAGTYPAQISATSAWGGDTQTLSLAVLSNLAPVSSNQTVTSIIPGQETTITLLWSDADQPQLLAHTFPIVANPSRGTLTSYFQRNGTTNSPNVYYYKAATNFIGNDTFTWKCNDGGADSNVGTVTVPIVGNHPPTANNGSMSAASGQQTGCSLSYSHADTSQTLTFSIVSQPAHGSVSCGGTSSATYTSAPGYAGGDSFTWKCNDGIDDSNIATINITVNGSVPVPQNQTTAVRKDTATDIAVSYTGGGGYAYNVVKVGDPSHGTAASIDATTFRYMPAAGYLGMDSFSWRMSYNGTGTTATVTCSILVKEDSGNDWPQWRCDEYRSAVTLQTLPSPLYLQWRRDYPAPAPAWPNHTYFNFDRNYEPVAVGKRLFVPSNKGDFVEALDTDTGAILWRFHAEGPVRFAPVAYSNKVAFGSDDGSVYCLNAADGTLAWKFQAAPSARKVTGNVRLVSVWPVRGGPVLRDGRLYLAAGLWPLEGTFVYCVDAVSGAEIWRNDLLGGLWGTQPHDGAYVAGGPAPQGYLAVGSDNTKLFMPSSRSRPARFFRQTGELDYWAPHNILLMGGDWGKRDSSGTGWYFSPVTMNGVDPMAGTTAPVGVTAGSRTYASTDAAGLGVSGTVGSMLVADGKLFAVNTAGSVYCFGGAQVSSPPIYTVTTTPLPGTSDSWTTTVQTMLSRIDLKEGMVLVLGVGTGRIAEELAKQTTNLKIVLVDTNAARIAALRTEMNTAGLYGSRVTGIVADPMACRFPPMGAGLIVSEDSSVAGYASGQGFVEKLYGWLRPFGGEVWVPATDPQHAAISGWVSGSTNMPLSEVSRSGAFTRIKRTGMTVNQATLKVPIGILWYGDVWSMNPSVMAGQIGGSRDLYTGLPMTSTTEPGAIPSMPAGPDDQRTNPLYGFRETREIVAGYGCGGGPHPLSWNIIGRRAGSHMINDLSTESGSIHIPGVRPLCSPQSDGTVSNGVLYEYSPGCSCAYALTASSSAWVNTPDAEQDNWSFWSSKRTRELMEEKPIRTVGVNFGAPGQRMAEDGVLWLEHPYADASLLTLPVYYQGSRTRRAHHSSRIQGQSNRKWVFGSNVSGATNIQVGMSWPVVALRLGTGQEPVMDGRLDDVCWDGQARVRIPREGDTTFSLRYDSTSLYIGWKSTAYAGAITLSDRTLAAQGAVIRIGWGYNNEVFTKESSGIDSNAWTAAFTVTNGLAVEVALPWAALETLGFWKEQLVINVGRNYGPWLGDGYCPVFLDSARGLAAQSRPHRVRLYFAETEGAAAGQRVFDVRLQGQMVLTGFDIAREAGGLNRGVIREFTNVGITDFLNMDLTPSAGAPLISGIEIQGTYDPGSNRPPVAVITATPESGASPLTVTLSARQSFDPDGQIKSCLWDFGDGDTATGSQVTHTFGAPGNYVVGLRVQDNDGSAGAVATKTIAVLGGRLQDFVSAIRVSGGDYTNLSSWQSAMVSDITSATSLVFLVSDRGTYTTADDGGTVSFAGGGSGLLKHINTSGVAYIVNCAGAANGLVTCASGRSFVVADAGLPVMHVVAECYNDWPTGLVDNVSIAGWKTSTSHMIKIRAAQGHRHNGTLSLTQATGFTLRTSADTPLIRISQDFVVCHVQLDGLCLYNSSRWHPVIDTTQHVSMRGCIVNGGSFGLATGVRTESDVVNCIFYGQAEKGIMVDIDAGRNLNVFNSTFCGSPYGIYRMRCSDVSAVLNVVNCLMKCSTAGIAAIGAVSVNHTACSDATADDWGGTGNRINQTFRFVNEAGYDFHLAADDHGATDVGSGACLVLDDIDGQARPAGGAWDIGADEAPAVNAPPAITSVLTANGSVGQAFSYTITASGSIPITFGASGLPPGLSLGGAAISGTPTTACTSNVTLTAVNAYGGVTNTLVLTIMPENHAPTVATAAGATPGTVTGTSTALSVLGADDGGEANLTYTWATTGTPPAPVTFSPNGNNSAKSATATFSKAGNYSFEVAIRDAGGMSVTSTVPVAVNQTLTGVSVAPASASVQAGGTQQFTALGMDQFGQAMSSQPGFAWSVSGGGTISASGLFTAGATDGGPYTVTATGAGKSGTANVTVSSMPSGLLAWWNLDETTGASASDASGNGHAAVLQGGAAWTTSGKTGGALQLAGANDMMLANPVVTLPAAWTISAWFTAPLPATATWHTLTRCSASSGDHQIITDSGLTLGMFDNTSGGQFRTSGFNMGSLSAGWHHIAAVATGTVTKFYIDGVLVGTSDRKGSGDVYAVGNYQNNNQRFSDMIDDVRVYDHELTATEVLALANPGTGIDAYGIPDAWKVQWFGSATATNSGAMIDADGDGMSNLGEYIAGTCPTNAGSRFQVSGFSVQGGVFGLSFQTTTGRLYSALYCDNLLAGGWGVLAPSNAAGTGGQMTITDTNKPAIRFYRLGVKIQ